MTDFLQDPDRGIRERLLTIARECGAGAADVIAMRSQNLDISVREGRIEDASRAESFGIGLRVFKGHRHAYGSTADSSEAGLLRLAQQVCDMAEAVPEDAYTRLATAGELASDFTDSDLVDTAPMMDAKALAALGARTEAAGLAVAGISKSDSASAGQSLHWIGLSTSEGFSHGYANSGAYISLSVIAGAEGAMETDSASSSAVYASDLEAPEVVGTRAAERTVAKLNPRTGKTGAYPVVFDKRVSSSLLRTLARAVSGPRIAKGTSFLCGKLGQKILADDINIIDDPFVKRGHRSSPFDAEGLAVRRRAIVDAGVLNHLFLDLRSAARLGLQPTGHASRGLASPPSPSPSNLWIEAGDDSLETMLKNMGEGFLVTDLMGASISLSTGNYSRGASGFWVEGGQIAYPVSEMTIAGNLADMFLHMRPASDLEFRSGIDAPSLLVEGMTTASR